MLQFLPSPVKGTFNYAALLTNTTILAMPIFALSALKLIPDKSWQKTCTLGCIKIAEAWIGINSILQEMTLETQYHITGGKDLKYDGWYMVISNHQSWADILVLQRVFNLRMPFLKFGTFWKAIKNKWKTTMHSVKELNQFIITSHLQQNRWWSLKGRTNNGSHDLHP